MRPRTVLPRLSDWIEDALQVQQALPVSDDNDWKCLIFAFAGAFNHLWIDPPEIRHVGGRAFGGAFAYMVYTIGGGSCP